MRRCVLCGRWVLLAFQVEGGEFVCEAARLGLGGGRRRMRRRVLCGCWARLAFPRAREKKSSSSHIGKIDEACQSNSCPPAPDRRLVGAGMNTPDRGGIGEWPRRGQATPAFPSMLPPRTLAIFVRAR